MAVTARRAGISIIFAIWAKIRGGSSCFPQRQSLAPVLHEAAVFFHPFSVGFPVLALLALLLHTLALQEVPLAALEVRLAREVVGEGWVDLQLLCEVILRDVRPTHTLAHALAFEEQLSLLLIETLLFLPERLRFLALLLLLLGLELGHGDEMEADDHHKHRDHGDSRDHLVTPPCLHIFIPGHASPLLFGERAKLAMRAS